MMKKSIFLILFSILIAVNAAATAQLHNTAGLAYYYQGKYALAFEEFLSALKIDSNNVVSHFNLGRVFERQGKLKDAFVQYQRALSLDPTHRGAKLGYERLIRFKEKQELRVKTEDELLEEKIKKDDLRSEDARQELLNKRLRQIGQLFQERRLDDARTLIEQTLGIMPESGQLHFYMGRYYYGKEQYALSITSLRKALQYHVNEEDLVHYLIALNHEKVGDYKRAESSLRSALELSPSNAVYYEKLGEVLQYMGKDINAFRQFQEGLRVNPSSVDGRMKMNELGKKLSLQKFNEGRIAFEKRDYITAKELLEKALDIGQLPAAEAETAKNLLGISEYWVGKNQKIEKIRQIQDEKTSKISIEKTISFDEASRAGGLYEGRYVSWSGKVISVEQKKGYYEVLIDTDTDNNFQEDLKLETMFLVHVRGKIPSDRRLSYLGTAEVDGKFKERRYLKNPFNSAVSVRKQPVLYLTSGKFENPRFGSGFVRIEPQINYTE
jgi:tetratricopeptide (TPR) repeat protein